MKKIILLIIFIYPFLPLVSQSRTMEIGELINRQEYFKLKRELDKTDSVEVNAIVWNMANAFVNTYFNNPKEAIDNIRTLLNNYQNDIGVENSASMLLLLLENYSSQREYAVVATLSESLMNQFSSHKELYTIFEKYQQHFSRLSDVPKQRIDTAGTSVSFLRDSVGIIIIPVIDHNGKEHNFILDTGAEYSAISESSMSDFNTNIVVDSVGVIGTSRAGGKLGVSDRLSIGDMSAENVLFLVLADSLLSPKYEGRVVYNIDGIIGWDFIREFRNISIDNKRGIISFNTENQYPIATGNLIVSSLTPFVEVISETDTLNFILDTGTSINASILTNRNLSKHQNQIVDMDATPYRAGGIGGVITNQKVYNLPDFSLKIGQTALKHSIDIAVNDLIYQHNYSIPMDGIIGQDIILLCDIFFIDLSTMSVNMITAN